MLNWDDGIGQRPIARTLDHDGTERRWRSGGSKAIATRRKKLDWGWRLVESDSLVGIDTRGCKIVAEALAGDHDGRGYDHVRPEVKYREKSCVDPLLTGDGNAISYLEVKSVTWSRSGSGGILTALQRVAPSIWRSGRDGGTGATVCCCFGATHRPHA
jgi:hypothetical protein